MTPAVPHDLICNASDRQAIAEGCYFDDRAWRRVEDFISRFCCLSKGKWARKPIRLIPWQRDLIRKVYGWKRKDGTRRIRECYCEIPKKNGKSGLVSALVLYHLIADGEQGAEIYICAYTRKQAAIIFDEAVKMIRSSPHLSKILVVKDSFHCKEVHHPASQSKLVALSSDAPGSDGISAAMTCFDELHRQDRSEMFDVMKYSGLARDQPLLLSITTAGSDKTSICYRQHEYAEKVATDVIVDPAFLGVVYGATESEDHNDPQVWRRCNPGFGYILKEDDFRRELDQAKEDPFALNNFLRLRLNVWVQSDHKFIDMANWSRCNEPFDPTLLDGLPCVGGLDLATVDDTCALVLLFDVEGTYHALTHFWLPEENGLRREKRDRVPYLHWAKQGYITLTPGDVVDYSFIEKHICDLAVKYDIRNLLCDPWNATQLCLNLQSQGIPLEYLRQNNAVMNAPLQFLPVLLSRGKIRTGGNPVLTWQASNAVASQDSYGLMRLSKSKNREKVDGIQALCNSLFGAMIDGALCEPGISSE